MSEEQIKQLLTAFTAAADLVEKLAPTIKELFEGGEATVADQKNVKDAMDRLRSSDAFSGPEWKVG